jgi:hypothetical protein
MERKTKDRNDTLSNRQKDKTVKKRTYLTLIITKEKK